MNYSAISFRLISLAPRQLYDRLNAGGVTVPGMGLLPDTPNCRLRMRRECRERFPCHRLQRKPLVSDPGMHHGTCVTHVPWCMSGSLTRSGGDHAPGIPSACATHNIAYLARGPWVNAIDTKHATQHNKAWTFVYTFWEVDVTQLNQCPISVFVNTMII